MHKKHIDTNIKYVNVRKAVLLIKNPHVFIDTNIAS